jgi:hypothetical protein
MEIKAGNIVTVKRKPTNENNATLVRRPVMKVDNEKQTFISDDAIEYKFSDIRYVAQSGRSYQSTGDLDVETWDKMSPLDRMKHLNIIHER